MQKLNSGQWKQTLHFQVFPLAEVTFAINAIHKMMWITSKYNKLYIKGLIEGVLTDSIFARIRTDRTLKEKLNVQFNYKIAQN